jgi:hypothetical protein
MAGGASPLARTHDPGLEVSVKPGDGSMSVGLLKLAPR